MCAHECNGYGVQKRAFDLLELKLQVVSGEPPRSFWDMKLQQKQQVPLTPEPQALIASVLEQRGETSSDRLTEAVCHSGYS